MPSGNIIVAGKGQFGSRSKPNQIFTHSMVLVRYNPDGTLSTYNAIQADKFDAFFYAQATDLAIQSDGKIVVAGSVLDGNDEDMFVARFKMNFEIDDSFGDSGHRFIDFWGTDDRASAVTLDYTGTPSTNPRYGSIVVVGTRDNPNRDQMLVARLKPNGNLDSTFADNGKFQSLLSAASTEGGGVVMQPDGKIVVTGTATFTSPLLDNKFAMARLGANGAMDPTFGAAGTGWVTTDLFGDDRAHDVIRSFDGALLVGGSTNGKFAVIQYSANGLIDRGFGTNGYVVTPFSDHAEISALAAGPGRRFVAVGGAQFHTARYLDSHANLVTVGTFNPSASEQGPKSTSFIVGRTERLPYPTRVYLSIGGTATGPARLRITDPLDYTLSGITVPPMFMGAPYVDIPANQTYTVVTLTPRDDSLIERTETALFTVMPNSAYDLGTPASTTITIADNDRLNFIIGGSRLIRSASVMPALRAAGLFSDSAIDDLIRA
jgi:uncharacterized delta-60 repeat protein